MKSLRKSSRKQAEGKKSAESGKSSQRITCSFLHPVFACRFLPVRLSLSDLAGGEGFCQRKVPRSVMIYSGLHTRSPLGPEYSERSFLWSIAFTVTTPAGSSR